MSSPRLIDYRADFRADNRANVLRAPLAPKIPFVVADSLVGVVRWDFVTIARRLRHEQFHLDRS